jgi:hypothetical protein
MRDPTPAALHLSVHTPTPHEKVLLANSDRVKVHSLIQDSFATAYLSLRTMVLGRLNGKSQDRAFVQHVYQQLKVCEPHLLTPVMPPQNLRLADGWIDTASDTDFAIILGVLASHPNLATLDVSNNPRCGDDRGIALLKLIAQNRSILHVDCSETAINPELTESIEDQCEVNRQRARKRDRREKKKAEAHEQQRYEEEVTLFTKELRRREVLTRREIDNEENEVRRKLMAVEHMANVKVHTAIAWRKLREEHQSERAELEERETHERSHFSVDLAAAMKRLGLQQEGYLRRIWRMAEVMAFEQIGNLFQEGKLAVRKIEERRRQRKRNERSDFERTETEVRRSIIAQEIAARSSLQADEREIAQAVRELTAARIEREVNEVRRRKNEKDRQEKEKIVRRERERQEELKRQSERIRERDKLSLKAQHEEYEIMHDEDHLFTLLVAAHKATILADQKRGETHIAQEAITRFCRTTTPDLRISGPTDAYVHVDYDQQFYRNNICLQFGLPTDAEPKLSALIDAARAKRKEAVATVMKAKYAVIIDNPDLHSFAQDFGVQVQDVAPDFSPSATTFLRQRCAIKFAHLSVRLKSQSESDGVTQQLALHNLTAGWKVDLESETEIRISCGPFPADEDGSEIRLKDFEDAVNCVHLLATADQPAKVKPTLSSLRYDLKLQIPALGVGSVNKRGLLCRENLLTGLDDVLSSFSLNVAILPSFIRPGTDATDLHSFLGETLPTFTEAHRWSDVLRGTSTDPPLLPRADPAGWMKLPERSKQYNDDFRFNGYQFFCRIRDPSPGDILFLMLEPDVFRYRTDESGSKRFHVLDYPVRFGATTITASHMSKPQEIFSLAATVSAQSGSCTTLSVESDAQQGMSNAAIQFFLQCVSFACSRKPIPGYREIEVEAVDPRGVKSRTISVFHVHELESGTCYFDTLSRRRPFHNISAPNQNNLASLFIDVNCANQLRILPDPSIMVVQDGESLAAPMEEQTLTNCSINCTLTGLVTGNIDGLKLDSSKYSKRKLDRQRISVSGSGTSSLSISAPTTTVSVVCDLLHSIFYAPLKSNVLIPEGTRQLTIVITAEREFGGPLQVVESLPIIVTPALIALPMEQQRRPHLEGSKQTQLGPFLHPLPHPLLINCFNGGSISCSITQGLGPEDELIFLSRKRLKENGLYCVPLSKDEAVSLEYDLKLEPFGSTANAGPQFALDAMFVDPPSGVARRVSASPPGRVERSHSMSVRDYALAMGDGASPGPARALHSEHRLSLSQSILGDSISRDISPQTSPKPSPITLGISSTTVNSDPVVEKPEMTASLLQLAGSKKMKKLIKVPQKALEGCLVVGATTLFSPLSDRRGSRLLLSGDPMSVVASEMPGDGSLILPFAEESLPLAAASSTARATNAIRDHVRMTSDEYVTLAKGKPVQPNLLVRRALDDSELGVLHKVSKHEFRFYFSPFREGINAATLQDAINVVDSFAYYCNPCRQLSNNGCKFVRVSVRPTDGSESQAVVVLDVQKANPNPQLRLLHGHRRMHSRLYSMTCQEQEFPIAPYGQSFVLDLCNPRGHLEGYQLTVEIMEGGAKHPNDQLTVLSKDAQQRVKNLMEIWRQEQLFLLSKGEVTDPYLDFFLKEMKPTEWLTELLPTMYLARASPGVAQRPRRSKAEEERTYVGFCYTEGQRHDYKRFQIHPQAEGGPRNDHEAVTLALNSVGLSPAEGHFGPRHIKCSLADPQGVLVSVAHVVIDVSPPDVVPAPPLNASGVFLRKCPSMNQPISLLAPCSLSLLPKNVLQRGYIELKINAGKEEAAPSPIEKEALGFFSKRIQQHSRCIYVDGAYVGKLVLAYPFHLKLNFDWATEANEDKIKCLLDSLSYVAMSSPAENKTIRTIELLFSDGARPESPSFYQFNVTVDRFAQYLPVDSAPSPVQ